MATNTTVFLFDLWSIWTKLRGLYVLSGLERLFQR